MKIGLDNWSTLDWRVTKPEAEAAFTTYHRYLQHISLLISGYYGLGPDLGIGVHQPVAAQPALKGVRRTITREQREDLQKHLTIAWIREGNICALLDQPVNYLPELLPGNTTHAYYAVFHGAQAYFTAAGHPRYRDHAQVLRSLGNEVIQRRIFPIPWSVACRGLPEPGSCEMVGLPADAQIGFLHNFQAPDPESVWSAMEKMLRTTRDRDFEIRKADWRKRNSKKRVPRAAALELADNMSPTTLFNFIWRLRTRTDYRDVDAFLEGISLDEFAQSFLATLIAVVQGTVAVFEALVAAYAGEDVLRQTAKRFSERAPKLSSAVRERVLLEVQPPI